jgi:FkbM family methyltransferase
VLYENLAQFGDRAHVVRGAAGTGDSATIYHDYTSVEGYPDEYVATNRYIGGVWREDPGGGVGTEVPVVTLAGLMAEHGIDELALLKTDCEGGEYAFLSDPKANERVQTILGEWHDSPTGDQRIRDLLPAHDIVRSEPEPGGITGLFEAVLR